MTITTQTPLDLAAVEALSRELQEPEWVARRRRQAWMEHREIPFPARTEGELWRRSEPERFRFSDHELASPSTRFDSLSGGGLPEGFCGLDFPSALGDPRLEELLALEEYDWGESRWWAILHRALVNGGGLLEVGRDTIPSEPACIHHRTETGAASLSCFPHSVVRARENSRATVVEIFESGPGELLAVPRMDLHVEQGARLQYLLVHRWGDATRVLSHLHARVERDGQLRVLTLGLGGGLCKLRSAADMGGPGSASQLLGLFLAAGRQHLDIDTLHRHLVSHTTSDVQYNMALTGRARTIFSGNIIVAPGAQKTDAYQKNRNLILSPRARADSIPMLEIQADDVRCTHGSTFATYDQEQSFYLRSRGLPEAEARRLILTGFFCEVTERLEGEAVREWLDELMTERMEKTLKRNGGEPDAGKAQGRPGGRFPGR